MSINHIPKRRRLITSGGTGKTTNEPVCQLGEKHGKSNKWHFLFINGYRALGLVRETPFLPLIFPDAIIDALRTNSYKSREI